MSLTADQLRRATTDGIKLAGDRICTIHHQDLNIAFTNVMPWTFHVSSTDVAEYVGHLLIAYAKRRNELGR